MDGNEDEGIVVCNGDCKGLKLGQPRSNQWYHTQSGPS